MQQRGTVRRRSPSDTGDTLERPSQRHRSAHSHPTDRTPSVASQHTPSPTTTVAANHSPEPAMGPPLTTNGTGNGTTEDHVATSANGVNGPFSLPHAVVEQVRPFHPDGTLMYADDSEWAPDQAADMLLDETSEMPEGADERSRAVLRQQAFGRRMPIDREEIVRLMLQGLSDMGYQQSADVLAKESGFSLATRAARDFEAAILGGRWSEASALLPDLGITPSAESTVVPAPEVASSRSSITSSKTKATTHEHASDRAKFLIARQKYLEFLEAGHQKKALVVLRSELAASATDPDALHALSGFMMCLDRDDLYERAKWDGAAGISRRLLLERLQDDISPTIMVPQRRLATLLDQARQHQQVTCLYHDDNQPISLYTDHLCTSPHFPSITTHVLMDHTDEVWRIEWSPNGNMLASASKDRTVVIWQLQPPSQGNGRQYSIVPLHHLKGHRGCVDALAWSPDSESLATASDKQVYLWDVKTGTRTPLASENNSPHADTISAIQWMPDGTQFVVSSLDSLVVFYDLLGRIVRKWTISNLQVSDFVITPDATRIVAATTWLRRVPVHNKLRPSISSHVETSEMSRPHPGDPQFEYGSMDRGVTVIRIADRDIVDYNADFKASTDVTSVKLSHDGQRVLVSCAPDELQVFALEPHLHLLRKFVGHLQSRFLIRSGFGAPRDRFVLSGSEDGHVYVWQSNSTNPLEVLSGHSDTVNAVAWNPILSRKLFASCSDDGTIRIWQPPLPHESEETEGAIEVDDEEGMQL